MFVGISSSGISVWGELVWDSGAAGGGDGDGAGEGSSVPVNSVPVPPRETGTSVGSYDTITNLAQSSLFSKLGSFFGWLGLLVP